MTPNYNKLVDTLKSIARDFLRMKIVVRLQSALATAQDGMNHVLDCITNVEKDIARVTYKMSLVDSNDPDAKEKGECLTKQLDELKEDLTELKGVVTENAQKEIDEVNKEITAVQSGEKKVNLDELNEYTKILLAEVTKDAAVTAAHELSA